jgi:hypothetical protein
MNQKKEKSNTTSGTLSFLTGSKGDQRLKKDPLSVNTREILDN